MSVALSVRLPEAVDSSLEAYVAQQGDTRSAVVSRALDEWIRVQNHPGLRFVTLPNGERTVALERGPEVWTVAEAWVMADSATRSVEETAYVTGLTVAEVQTALRYYAEFQGEIDAEMARVWRAQELEQAAWERLRGIGVH